MPIVFDEKNKLFTLSTDTSSYVIEIFDAGYLLHLYYGAKLPALIEDSAALAASKYRGGFASFCPIHPDTTATGFATDLAPMEYSCNQTGDYRISALQIRNANGDSSTDIRYKSHRIYNGKNALPGLPSTYAAENEAQTLELTAIDAVTGAEVTLTYTVFEKYGAMTRSVKVLNTSNAPFDIERLFSCCIDLPDMNYNMHHLYGEWYKERNCAVNPLHHGNQSIKSSRGSSSHNHNPFIALANRQATEETGDVYGFNLVYSGNFLMEVEVNSRETARFIGGINPDDFGWRLLPDESFQSPEMVMIFSENGLGGMSRSFHKLYMKHLIRSKWRDIKRPVLINSWEAAFFDFDDEKLVSFAHEAAKLNIDMLVMDDGWFGKRNSDTCSLGDWFVNEDKLKGGLTSLIERVSAEGLKFGIWYEPEMISPDSDLFRAHPDWCLQVKGREKSLGRRQYVLDMSREDVRDNIFNQMHAVLSKNNIEYLKWDFNRNLSEVGSLALPPEKQKEVCHRFVLGTYELMDRFTKAFPNILFENCSGGGGRFDPGMLYYSPQIWCSDNTDPIERLSIQFGSSMCYPISSFGAHVSHDHRASIHTRAAVALCGTFGYELDPRVLTDDEKEIVRDQVASYHRYNSLIQHGDFYRLVLPQDNKFYCSWQFVSEDKKETLVTLVTMRRKETPYLVIKLRGLNEHKLYRHDESGSVYSGGFLMKVGLNLTGRSSKDDLNYDGASVVMLLTAVD